MSRKMPSGTQLTRVEELQSTTPARIAVGRAGCRPRTETWLLFRRDHAMAKDAVKGELAAEFLESMRRRGYPVVRTLAENKYDFIAFPPKGKRTDDNTMESLLSACVHKRDVQICISDGLSVPAVEMNVPVLLPLLLEKLAAKNISVGTPVIVQYGRVRIADQITAKLQMHVGINLVGERPGLSAADSLSAYITYRPGPETLSSERTVLSNIHGKGTPPDAAAQEIADLVEQVLRLKLSGVAFQQAKHS